MSIQTACRHCNQDIENSAPYRKGEWRDRGNNTQCPWPSEGHPHAPITPMYGKIVAGHTVAPLNEDLAGIIDRVTLLLSPLTHAERNAVLVELSTYRSHWFQTEPVKTAFQRITR